MRGSHGLSRTFALLLSFSTAAGLTAGPAGDAAAGASGQWAAGFGVCGVGGEYVGRLAVYDGELIASGIFESAGGVSARNVARWDGESWHPLGAGIDADHGGPLGTWNGQLVVAAVWFDPDFHLKFLTWDGATWAVIADSILGGGIRAFASYQRELIAAGSFTSIEGVPVNSIARFDGTTWRPLGAGITGGGVIALARHGLNLIAAGTFTTAGGAPASRIAAWDGSSWMALGSGTDDTVTSLAVFDGDLAAAGAFHLAGGVAADRVALWNGAAWTALGAFPEDRDVQALAAQGTSLYTGTDRVHRWSGGAWTQVGTSFGGGPRFGAYGIYAMVPHAGGLCVAGDFTEADGKFAPHVARWDGAGWDPVPSSDGLAGGTGGLAVYQDQIVAVGDFVAAGTTLVNQAARWSGSSWHPMSEGFPFDKFYPPPQTAASYQGHVVVGGCFEYNGQSIQLWDGTAWQPLGQGIGDDNWPGWVEALAARGATLAAGGGFNLAGGAPADNVAAWDGAAWHALGAGLDGFVTALAYAGSELFAGGEFTSSGGVPMSHIARWTGSAWEPLGSGTNGPVFAIAPYPGGVIAAGDFTEAGGAPASRIASWDGTGWAPLAEGFNAPVRALALYHGTLVAGGEFTEAGGAAALRLARWNGVAWQHFGEGLGGTATSLAVLGDDLWVGGGFGTAGGILSSGIARWTEAAASVPGPLNGSMPPEALARIVAAWPSPAHDEVTIELALAQDATVDLAIFDVGGREVGRLHRGALGSGARRFTWRPLAGNDALPPGVYFARLATGNSTDSRKIIVMP